MQVVILPDRDRHLVLGPDSVVVLPAAATHVVVDRELDREDLIRLPGVVIDYLYPNLELSDAGDEGDQLVHCNIVLARNGRAVHGVHHDLDGVF